MDVDSVNMASTANNSETEQGNSSIALNQQDDNRQLHQQDDNCQLKQEIDNRSLPLVCAICLEKVETQAFTDACLHIFCMECLYDWSDIKPECPLCKKKFNSIIYNVTAPDEYSVIKIQSDKEERIHRTYKHIHEILIHLMARYRARLLNNESIKDHPLQLTSKYINYTDAENIINNMPSRSKGIEYRTYIYQYNLYAKPHDGPNGLNCTVPPDAYANHRLHVVEIIAFLKRDFQVILQTEKLGYCRIVYSCLRYLNKTADATQFHDVCVEYLGVYTQHFLYELGNFVRASMALIDYDRSVVYHSWSEHNASILGGYIGLAKPVTN